MTIREIEEREKAGLALPGTAYFDEMLDRLSEVYGGDGGRYYVLEDGDGRVVGGIGFAPFPHMKDTAELQKLYLDDSVKGAGLSYRLIAFVEERMRERGFAYSYLETHDRLAAAIHVYKKCGYREIDRPDTVGHGGMNRFFLKRIEKMKELIGFCGLDCEKCEARIATMNNDDGLRRKVAAEWSALNNVEITPGMINCEGCRVDGKKTPYCDFLCPIRQCALKKKIGTCAGCEEMRSCEKLRQIADDSAEARENLNWK